MLAFAVSGVSLVSTADASVGSALHFVGVSVPLSVFVLACAAVRCPHCRARWIWRAVSKEPVGTMTEWLLALEKCPDCGHTPKERREEG